MGAPLLQAGGMPTGASANDVPAMGILTPGVIAPAPQPLVPDPAAPNLAALPVPPGLPAPPGHAAPDPAALPAPPVLPAPDLASWAHPVVAPPVLPRPLDLPTGKKAQRRAAAAARRMSAAAGGVPSADASPQGWASPISGPLGGAMGPSSGWGATTLRAAGPGHAAGGPCRERSCNLGDGWSSARAGRRPSWGRRSSAGAVLGGLAGRDALAGAAAGPAMHSGSQTAAELGGPDAKRRRTARGAGARLACGGARAYQASAS